MLKEIENEVKNGLSTNLFLIHGEEQFLVLKFFNEIKNLIVNSDSPLSDMNCDIFEGEKSSVSSIADAFSTLSFSNDKRFVGVQNSGLFSRGRADASTELLGYLDQIDESCVLTFTETEVDKRNKLYNYIKKNGKVFELKTQDENQLSNWVIALAKDYGKTIKKVDAIYLVSILNFDMFSIKSEVDKLVNYTQDDSITKVDIDLLVHKSLEIRVFELIDAISAKNSKLAINIYNNMLEMKESPLMILTMIGRQFKLILECKVLMEQKMSKDAIAKKIAIHPFVVQKCMGYSKNFTKLILYRGFEDILETDVKIKTGKIDAKLGVELIILKYCNNRGELK